MSPVTGFIPVAGFIGVFSIDHLPVLAHLIQESESYGLKELMSKKIIDSHKPDDDLTVKHHSDVLCCFLSFYFRQSKSPPQNYDGGLDF